MNKKGFLKVLEAVIAILLVSAAVTVVLVRNVNVEDRGENIEQIITIVLEEIAGDNQLRNAVLEFYDDNSASARINSTIDQIIPPDLSYSYNVCGFDQICPFPGDLPAGREIYSDEVGISVTLNSDGFNPKKLRIFVWEKE